MNTKLLTLFALAIFATNIMCEANKRNLPLIADEIAVCGCVAATCLTIPGCVKTHNELVEDKGYKKFLKSFFCCCKSDGTRVSVPGPRPTMPAASSDEMGSMVAQARGRARIINETGTPIDQLTTAQEAEASATPVEESDRQGTLDASPVSESDTESCFSIRRDLSKFRGITRRLFRGGRFN